MFTSPKNKILLGSFLIIYLFFVFVIIPKGVNLLVASKYNKNKSKSQSVVSQPITENHIAIPNPSPTPVPTPEVFPILLAIPSLNISANIEPVSLTETASMDVPKNAVDVAWYKFGAIPGQPGNAVINGHYDTPTGRPAVFYYLKNLQVGDDVKVVLSNNSVVNFVVTDKEDIPDDTVANENTNYIFNKKPGTNLNLITCDGIWNPTVKRYNKRIVVYTSLK
jgi:LPXTG-site transpeptidase (sortase) family protein